MYDHELEREILLAHTSSWCERESERERERERGREFRVAKKKCRGNLGRPNPVGRSVGRFSSVAVWYPGLSIRIADRYHFTRNLVIRLANLYIVILVI